MSKKFLYFFDQYQKKSLLLLFCFMSITTILEMIGLGFIFSIVGALGSKNITNNLFINKLSSFFELDKTEIFSYLLLVFLLFYIIKIVFLTFYNWFEGNFLYSYKENLSSKLFKEYLNQEQKLGLTPWRSGFKTQQRRESNSNRRVNQAIHFRTHCRCLRWQAETLN